MRKFVFIRTNFKHLTLNVKRLTFNVGRFITTLCFWLVVVSLGYAQASGLMNYQGRLMDSGDLVNAEVTMIFRLYDDALAGREVYAQTQTVTVVDGLYSVELGGSNPVLFQSALTNAQLWLDLQIGGQLLSPRERLNATPYVLQAQSVFGGIHDADTDSTQERLQSFDLDTNNVLSVIDAGGTWSVDLSGLMADVTDQDGNSTNETVSHVFLMGTVLNVVEGGITQTVDLVGLLDGVTDADVDVGGELLQSVQWDGLHVELIDAGGTHLVDLAPLVGDADADPTQEQIAAMVLDNGQLIVTEAGETQNQNLSSLQSIHRLVMPGNTQVVVEVTDTGFVGVANQQPQAGLHLSGGRVAGDTNTPRVVGLVSDYGVGVGMPTPGAALDVEGRISAQAFQGDGSALTGLPIVDGDPSNELNSELNLTGTVLTVTDGGGSLVVDLSTFQDGVEDADAHASNEWNTAMTFTGSVLQVTDAGGGRYG